MVIKMLLNTFLLKQVLQEINKECHDTSTNLKL